MVPLKDREAWPKLVCPADQGLLKERQGFLVCPQGHRWELRQDIPRLLEQRDNYAEAFGLQWKTYRRTQLDSETGAPLSYERARRCLGDAGWSELSGLQRVDVLEVGCGAGRFTEVLLKTPSAFVTSLDLSSAVEANQENFPQNDRHRVIQADVLRLPFAPGQFDLVFCLGVVQHTPVPEETLACLYEQVKPGGRLVFDHYTYSLSRWTKLAPLFRQVLKRLPPERGLVWTERLVRLFFPLHKTVRRVRPFQMLLSRFSPVLVYFHALPHLDDRTQYALALLDTHDTLTDWYKHSRGRGRLRKTLKSLGAQDIYAAYGGNGVEVRCRRPSAHESQMS